MTAFRRSASMTPVDTATEVTPGTAPTWVSTSLWIWVRSGQPATVSATSTSTRPPPAMRMAVTMPNSTMSAPNSGSTTPRRAVRTRSSVGTGRPTGSGSEVSGLVTSGILLAGPACHPL